MSLVQGGSGTLINTQKTAVLLVFLVERYMVSNTGPICGRE